MESCEKQRAMHEENFRSSWLREDWKSKTKEDKEVREDEGGKEKSSVEAFDIVGQGEISECDSVCGSVAELGKWSSSQVSNDIFMPSSFAGFWLGVRVGGSVDVSGVLCGS